VKILHLDAQACDVMRHKLSDLLLDAVAHGASPDPAAIPHGRHMQRYWDDVRAAVAAGTRVLLAAAHDGALLGTVQLDLCQRPDGRQRADVRALMVHDRVRQRGIGGVLLRAAEAEARALGRVELRLATEAGSGADALIRDLGYARADGASYPQVAYTKTLPSQEAA